MDTRSLNPFMKGDHGHLMKPLVKSAVMLAAVITSATAADKPSLDSRALFNGKDLTGWVGEGYIVEDGCIVSTPKARVLRTEATFSNYVLDFEFKLTPGANNGLGIHYPGQGDGAYTGMELQILDSNHSKYKDLKPYQFHGSLYTMVPAKQGALKPAGEWNKERVIVMGPHLRVELNGEQILDVNLDKLATEFPKHEGVKRRSGHIGWLGHGDQVFFRNIHIAETPPPANIDGVKQAGFQPLFDGKSLAGWKHTADTTNWSAINGILKHDGKPGKTTHLWTEKHYKDFILVFDWRWSGRGQQKVQPLVQPDGTNKGSAAIEELDSGILLRGEVKSQVNLWNWNVGSGEVYGYRTDKKMPPEVIAAVTPKKKADRPLGEWNRMMITMKGEKLTVVLNGEEVIDEATLPGVPAEGSVGLQHHGQAIDFANLWIKEL